MINVLLRVSAQEASSMLSVLSPVTGDTSRPWLWAVVGGVAAVLVALLAITGKRGGHGDDDDGDNN